MPQIPEDRVSQLMEMEPAEVMAGYRAGRISRRDMGKLFAALGLTSALGPAFARSDPRRDPTLCRLASSRTMTAAGGGNGSVGTSRSRWSGRGQSS